MTVAEAGRQLRARELEMEVEGSGLTVRQAPGAGGYAPLGSTVQVYFELPQGTE